MTKHAVTGRWVGAMILALSGCATTQAEPGAAKAPSVGVPAAPASAAPAGSSGVGPAAGAPEAGAPAAAGSATPGGVETRTMTVIRKIVLANRKAVRACYDAGRKKYPTLEGNMVMHFVLAPDGKVESAELNIERSNITAASVVACAVKAIKAMQFPPSSRGMETTVNYPFNFHP